MDYTIQKMQKRVCERGRHHANIIQNLMLLMYVCTIARIEGMWLFPENSPHCHLANNAYNWMGKEEGERESEREHPVASFCESNWALPTLCILDGLRTLIIGDGDDWRLEIGQ